MLVGYQIEILKQHFYASPREMSKQQRPLALKFIEPNLIIILWNFLFLFSFYCLSCLYKSGFYVCACNRWFFLPVIKPGILAQWSQHQFPSHVKYLSTAASTTTTTLLQTIRFIEPKESKPKLWKWSFSFCLRGFTWMAFHGWLIRAHFQLEWIQFRIEGLFFYSSTGRPCGRLMAERDRRQTNKQRPSFQSRGEAHAIMNGSVFLSSFCIHCALASGRNGKTDVRPHTAREGTTLWNAITICCAHDSRVWFNITQQRKKRGKEKKTGVDNGGWYG